MNERMIGAVSDHGARMAGRLSRDGAAQAVASIARVRTRRRAATALAALVPVLLLAGGAWWLATVGSRALPPATGVDEPVIQISLDEPLEIQLRHAIFFRDYAAMSELLRLGAYPREVFEEDREIVTYATFAMQSCDVDALRVLDEHGVPRVPYWLFPPQDLALTVAMERCPPETVEAVIESAPERPSERAVMRAAVENAPQETLIRLVEQGHPLEVPGEWSALGFAAANEDYARMELLLEWGADPTIEVDGVPLIDWLDKAGIGGRERALIYRLSREGES